MTRRDIEKKLSELRESYDKARKAKDPVKMKNIESEGKKYKEVLEQMKKPCGGCKKRPRINLYFCEKCEVRK
jgi:hypothetical protein